MAPCTIGARGPAGTLGEVRVVVASAYRNRGVGRGCSQGSSILQERRG